MIARVSAKNEKAEKLVSLNNSTPANALLEINAVPENAKKLTRNGFNIAR